MTEFSSRRGLGRVRFFAAREMIETDIAKGYPLTAIYDRLNVTLAMSYSQFARYVASFIKPSIGLRPNPTPAVSDSPSAAKTSSGSVGQPRFSYDPTIPKERLI